MDKQKILLPLGCVALGILIGYGIFGHASLSQSVRSIRENASSYKFINPLLFVETTEQNGLPEYRSLQNVLEDYRAKALRDHTADDISIYFRDMNASKWIGVNETATFSPASMLKVVTMIATLREAENNPNLLKSKTYIKNSNITQNDNQIYYLPKNPVVPGQNYTIDELLQRMIIDSDDIANSALSEIIGVNKINQTYNDLDLPIPDISHEEIYTTQQYSHLFRALYNGTYLSKKISEQVLELLSKTHFDKGLVAGVPTGTIVSHKFGVRNILADGAKPTDEPTARELHDCGIVYYPDNPYFLCVITRGKDFPTLEEVIKDISKIAWDEVSKMK